MFKGRIDRKGFIIGYLVAYTPIFILGVIAAIVGGVLHINIEDVALNHGPVVFWSMMSLFLTIFIYAFGFFYPVVIGLSVRRLHDMGQNGLWSFLQLGSTIGVIAALFQAVYPGENGPNEYGDPESPRQLLEILYGPSKPKETQPPIQPTTL